jgi:SNF2 family DNA or RNA helicase
VTLTAVRALPLATRHAAADIVRVQRDFTLPELAWFNSRPCGEHTTLTLGCRRCGIRLRKHQRVGVAWLYMRGRGLIADQVGTGKTAQAAGLIAACKQAGELERHRTVIVVRPAALDQWHQELNRFLPRLTTITAAGTRRQRTERYLSGWDILVIGHQMLVNDLDAVTEFDTRLTVVDDVDPLRNRNTRTAYAIKRLARQCERATVLTATPLQKQLTELHSVLEVVGGLEVFGSQHAFTRRYVREESVKIYNGNVGYINTRQVTGYRNLDEFITKIRPMTLRRTPADIDDVDLPVISPHDVFLDLHPGQKDRYAQLRRGVLKIIKEHGAEVKQTTAIAAFLYGQQICDGLGTLDGEADGPRTSVKLDWVEQVLTGDLADEKVVVFCQFLRTAEHLMARLTRAGIGHAVIWGRQPDKTARARAKDRFWDDPDCKVLVGTSAIEQSLNLQVSRHLINVDQLMNPARMQQLAGRIRRDGSRYKTVYVHNLFTRGTQEEGYLDVLRREQALADHVWGEANQLYEALNPLALLQLIGGSGGR